MASGELEPRVSALENEVRELKARVRGSEQDAAELRDFRQATVASFNAVRDDFADLRGEMRSKFELAAAGQQQIVALLETLIDRDTGGDG